MKRLILLIFFAITLQSCKNGIEFDQSDPVFKTGDNFSWAAKTYKEINWGKERGNTRDKVFWVRYHITINSERKPNDHMALEVNSFGAFEVYWDGVKIGTNGTPASKLLAEVPGTHTSDFLLPDSLSDSGSHVLALRATQTYHSNDQRGSGIKIGYYQDMLKMPLIVASVMNLMAGAFLVVALYYLFLYINSSRKNSTTLIFSIICFIFFTLLLAEYGKFYIEIPYSKFYIRLEIIGMLTFATSLLIPLYFSIQFSFRKKNLLLLILLLSLIVIYIFNYHSYDLTAQLFSACMWVSSVIISVYAVVKKEKGGWMVLLGLLISIVVNNFIYYDFGIFIFFTIIVLTMLYLQAIKTKEEENAHRSALLISSRLKLELLKKQIQPHFIKNTLTSLIDWVEESPKQGVIFIKALADEFDIMNDISEQTLIPVSSEIALCKAHLSVMQFRKEINYKWIEMGIDPLETIPPAIIHTVLENGITHSLPLVDGSVHFELSFSQEKEYKEYKLFTKAKNRSAGNDKRKRTGFKYIEARLNESYGNYWSFDSYAVTEGWMTKIKIYQEK